MALNGTREGLFNAAIALCPETKRGKRPVDADAEPVLPGLCRGGAGGRGRAGLRAGHAPRPGSCRITPSLPADVLDRAAVAYICSPANPQGAVAVARLLGGPDRAGREARFPDLRRRVLFRDLPRRPAARRAARSAQAVGADPERVVVFHSLSKRSNLPGCASGFMAGGPEVHRGRVKQLRAYAGAPLPLPLQRVAETVWADEAHVEENRGALPRKYRIADEVFAGIQGYRVAGGRVLPVAAGRGRRGGGAEALAGDRRAGAAGRVSCRGTWTGTTPARATSASRWWPEEQEMQRGLEALRDCLYEVRTRHAWHIRRGSAIRFWTARRRPILERRGARNSSGSR